MWSLSPNAPGKPLDRAQLRSELGLLFGAGFETTAHTIGWALFCLVTNPAAEEKVLQELDSLGLLASPSHPEPRTLVWEDLGKLKYLTAALNESMRLYPVVSTGTARITHEWTRVGPYLLPPKVPIITPFYSIHRSPRLWPKADQYLPERWLDSSSSSSSGTKLAAAGAASGTAEEAEQGSSSPATSSSSISTEAGAGDAAGGGPDQQAADASGRSSGSKVLRGAAGVGVEDVKRERDQEKDQDASPQVSLGHVECMHVGSSAAFAGACVEVATAKCGALQQIKHGGIGSFDATSIALDMCLARDCITPALA
jgi:hypothetical protein